MTPSATMALPATRARVSHSTLARTANRVSCVYHFSTRVFVRKAVINKYNAQLMWGQLACDDDQRDVSDVTSAT